jgi:predicted phosphodiesterase
MAAKESAFWLERRARLWELGHRVRTPTNPHGDLTWADAGRQLGVTAVQARQKFTRLVQESQTQAPPDLPPLPPPPPPPEPPPPPDPVEAEEARLARLRELVIERDALRAVAGEKSLRAFLERLVAETAIQFRPPPPWKAPPRAPGATEETLVQAFSDWHAYEIVSPERTRGFNTYDAATMGRRVRRVVETHLSIKGRMERGGGWRFRRLVLGLNGDFMSGTIHEVERHSDAPNVVMATYGTGLVLAQAIRDLAAAYETVDVFCTAGNHGRLPDARRMQQKDPTRSWDTLIYLFAREHLRQLPNLRWYIPDSYSVAFEVEGWRFLQTHGHDVKSWNAIPFYGINRMMANLNALEASRATPFHVALLGHFHNRSSMEAASAEYFVNGSLIGGTEFSVHGMGKADKPCQWLLGVHPEHGVTHRWPLLGEAPADAPGYEVAPWRSLVA